MKRTIQEWRDDGAVTMAWLEDSPIVYFFDNYDIEVGHEAGGHVITNMRGRVWDAETWAMYKTVRIV